MEQTSTTTAFEAIRNLKREDLEERIAAIDAERAALQTILKSLKARERSARRSSRVAS